MVQARVGHADRGRGGDSQVAAAPSPQAHARAHRLRLGAAHRQPAQAEQDQHRGHRLDHQLREREVGRGEPDVGGAAHQPGARGQHQRREAVELGLPGRPQRTDAADHPGHREHRREGQQLARAARRGRGPERGRRAGQRHHDHQQQLHLQAARAEDAAAAPADFAQSREQVLEHALAVEAVQQRRVREPAVDAAAPLQQVERGAAGQRDEAHQERQVEAMPDGQAVGRQFAAHHRLGGRGEEGADRPGRRDADHQADQHQQLDRHAHPVRRLVRLLGHVGTAGRPEEHVEHEARRVGDAEDAGQRGDHGQAPVDPGRRADEHGPAENISFDRKPLSSGTRRSRRWQ